METLIRNVMIIPMDKESGIIDRGYILIDENKIVKVKSGEFTSDTSSMDIIDGRGYCALPGLFNCHTHAAMTLLRGYGEGLPLMRWLNEKIWPMEAKFTEKHIEVGTRLAVVEMLRSGTVAFNDMYFYQEKVMEVAEEFNIRAVLGIPLIGDNWQQQLNAAVELTERVNRSDSGLIKSMFAPHSPYTLSKEALIEISKAAEQYEKGIHIHIAETEDEINIIKQNYNMTPCELLEQTGIFNNKTIGAHCVYLTNNDLNILKEHNVSAAFNPESNMKLASGTSPVVKMLHNGINVCFGTDGASSNNNLNMFEEIRSGAFLQKLCNKDTTVLDAKTVLNMATVNGARALGFEHSGVIKEGFDADIIMLNINKAHMAPMYDAYSNIVFSANGSEVEYVIINGNMVMKKGEFLSIDEEKIIYDSRNLCKTLI